jgi:glycosyltransferase involved in cell wall biosynthesis
MISVIIPVFNNAPFISKAIDSALIQTQVSEVIIIDDGSSDDSLSICKALASKNTNIKILQHPDKKNHGRSASRNLGIKNASGTYIAFLDADDFYLPDRFTNDLEILKDSTIDGVYNAISGHFYRDYTIKEKEKLELTTIREELTPESLFENMGPIGHCGYFSGIGLTVRRDIFDKTGYFNETLVVAEDTELWLKMSLKATLVGGILKNPVSMRGVHDLNVSFRSESLYNSNLLKMYDSLYSWGKLHNIGVKKLSKIWKRVWIYRRKNNSTLSGDLSIWFKELVFRPDLIFHTDNYKTFPLFWRLKNKF